MPAGRRRSMAEFLEQQRAIEDAPGPEQPAATSFPYGPLAGLAPRDGLPQPYAPSGEAELSAAERADLASCEAALDNLRMAFWAAGKALQVIRDARLYRDTHPTFEAYVEDRWEVSRRHAYRLIDAWPLAERLCPIGHINEGQIRELLPVADRHGQDAAVTVYQAVAGIDGIQVTAAVLHGVVGVLPADRFDPDEAVAQIRAYLAGQLPPPAPDANPVEAFTAEAAKLMRSLHRVADRGTFKAAAHADPEAVRQVITEVRKFLDEIERSELTT